MNQVVGMVIKPVGSVISSVFSAVFSSAWSPVVGVAGVMLCLSACEAPLSDQTSTGVQPSPKSDTGTMTQDTPTPIPLKEAYRSELGAVATVNPYATQLAADIYQRGGNAIDVAIAATFALGVVDGHNSGVGGGAFAIIRYADGRIEALDGREMAPAKAHRDMYVVNGEVDRSLSTTGPLASGIPGSVAMLEHMSQQGGKLAWADIIEPSAALAAKGFAIDKIYSGRLKRAQPVLQRFPASAAVFLDAAGNAWPTGHQLQQQDLANTYRAIGQQGSDYFYQGEFAQSTAQWMAQNGGLITQADMANYKMLVREPVLSDYRGYQVVGFPPPSSGGVHVAQMLNILENFELDTMSPVQRKHHIAEAMKLAFADRAYWLGDPDFVPVPKGLIDPVYAKALANKIQHDSVLVVNGPGQPPRAELDIFEKHTTHIATADRWGNWVAITTTVNTDFGSKVVIPGTGVFMNNQMDDFSAQPGVPNIYGLVGTEANAIAPGKRPLSSMSPTLVLKDNQPIFTLGAAGGPTIISQVLQTTSNLIDLKQSPAQALASPRIHHQWRPNKLFVEPEMPQAIKQGLQALGHELKDLGPYGSSQLIVKTSQGLDAQAEPRLAKRNQ